MRTKGPFGPSKMPPKGKPKGKPKDDTQNVEEDDAQSIEEGEATEEKKAKKKDVSWQRSYAKELLRKDLIDGTVPLTYDKKEGDLTAKEIYNMRPEYVPFGAKTFGARLGRLRKVIKNDQKRADSDLEAYNNYKTNHKVVTLTFQGLPVWDLSTAQELLRQDMDQDLHITGKDKAFKTIEKFFQSRPEYKPFGQDVFRKHIHQEKRLRKHLYTEKRRRAIKQGRIAKGDSDSDDDDKGDAYDEV